jgi:hypothetical protein
MKKIIIIFLIIANLGLFAQERNAPALGKAPDGTTQLIMWQYGLNSATAEGLQSQGTDKFKIHSSSFTSLGSNVPLATPDGYTITPLRVIDTLINGRRVSQCLFPKLAIRNGDDTSSLDGMLTIDPMNFGEVNLDSSSTKRLVLRNTGHSTLYLSTGNMFDTTNATILNNQNVGESYIMRADAEMDTEVAWQTRTTESAPIQGDDLQYADQAFDDFQIAIPPGDTASIYVDTRPTIVGRKDDTLRIDFTNGFQDFNYNIPLLMQSTWTIDYKISSLSSRPVTPTHDSEFLDTIRIANNRGNRTRIASMRFVFKFDPQNIYITGFELNPDFFSSDWTYNVEDFRETEKEGIISIEAYAEGNIALKQTATSSEDLLYFDSGTDGEEVVLCILKGKQLLGTSDTTYVDLDENLSQHNFSTDYLMDRDASLVADASPYMIALGGQIIADSLLFSDQLTVSAPGSLGRITKMYPNPVGDADFVTVVVELDAEEEVEGKLVFVDPYTGNTHSSSSNISFKPGENIIALRVPKIELESYLVALELQKLNDAKLLNIVK